MISANWLVVPLMVVIVFAIMWLCEREDREHAEDLLAHERDLRARIFDDYMEASDQLRAALDALANERAAEKAPAKPGKPAKKGGAR